MVDEYEIISLVQVNFSKYIYLFNYTLDVPRLVVNKVRNNKKHFTWALGVIIPYNLIKQVISCERSNQDYNYLFDSN